MQKGYYAVIPANVRYDNEISPNAKLLFGEITALCNEKGYCWAGNTYFADLYKKDKSTIARWIQQLEKKGYITREVVYKKGTREIENRYMRICNEGIGKIATTPIGKNAIDNITSSFNTTSNNKKELYTSEFEEFWSLYPRKIEKKDAYKSFAKALEKNTLDEILEGTKQYAQVVKGEKPKYIKHPATFLNKESFKNDYSQEMEVLQQNGESVYDNLW